MLDWDNLRVILAVSRHGTILGAARELDINAATVSRHVSRAEDVLEAKLFNRRHKGLSPTSAGIAAIDAAKVMEESVIALQRSVAGSNEAVEGVIRLSLPLGVMGYSFSNDLHQFQDMYPGITFDINVTDERVNIAELEADVVLRVDENPPSSLWGFRIATIGLSFFGSKDFMHKWGPKIENEAKTAPIPYIALSTANPAADRDEFLMRFPKAKPYAFCNGMDSLVPLVRDGVGAGRMARHMAHSCADFIKIFDCDERWSRSVWILTHRDYRDTKRIRVFMEFIRHKFALRMHSF